MILRWSSEPPGWAASSDRKRQATRKATQARSSQIPPKNPGRLSPASLANNPPLLHHLISHLSPPQFLSFFSLALTFTLSFFHHQLLVAAAAAVLFISPLSLIQFFINFFSLFFFLSVFRFHLSLSLPLCQILFQVNTPFSFFKGRSCRSFTSTCLPPCSRPLHIVRSFLFGIRLSIYAFHAKVFETARHLSSHLLSTLRLLPTHRLIATTPASSLPPFETCISK